MCLPLFDDVDRSTFCGAEFWRSRANEIDEKVQEHPVSTEDTTRVQVPYQREGL